VIFGPLLVVVAVFCARRLMGMAEKLVRSLRRG